MMHALPGVAATAAQILTLQTYGTVVKQNKKTRIEIESCLSVYILRLAFARVNDVSSVYNEKCTTPTKLVYQEEGTQGSVNSLGGYRCYQTVVSVSVSNIG